MTNNKLTIYRQGVEHLIVDIDERTMYSGAVMMENAISAVIVADTELDIDIDDYVISFWGEKFTVNQKPNVHYLESEKTVRHEVQFEGALYDLMDCQFRYHGNSFDPVFYGSASEFVDEVLTNLARTHSGWSKGSVAVTDRKFITFTSSDGTGVTCREALAIACEQFGLEFRIVSLPDGGQSIHMLEDIGDDTGVVFRVGKGRGLIDLLRFYPNDYKEFNRIYGVGSADNIPPDYRGGTTRLTFDPGYIERPLEPGEQRREASKVFDYIRPQRTGTVSSVGANGLSFTDDTLDFDLDDQRITGLDAKVEFTSGELESRRFAIKGWVADTKTIVIEPYEEVGREFPGENFEIKVGDTYVLIDIEMPQSYIDDAEARLDAALQEFGLKTMQPSYRTTNDQKFLRDNDIWLRAYDRVQVEDPLHGTSRLLRINRITFPYCDPFDAQFEISDEVLFSTIERQEIEQIETKQVVKEINRTSIERTRRNAFRTRQVMDLIFDPITGEQSRLSVTLIEAIMAVFGSLSGNLELYGVVFSSVKDATKLDITAGKLVHFDSEITRGGISEWNMPARLVTSLDPDISYYVYARCNKESNLATWVVSDTIIKLEEEAGYWHFFIGILLDEYDGGRDFKSVYGVVEILGNRITAGRVSSQSGLTFFDLNTDTIQGNIKFISGQSVEDALDDVEDKADQSLAQLEDMAADDKLTPVEKLELAERYTEITEEYIPIISQANSYGIPTAAYAAAYTSLATYLSNLLIDMDSTSTISRIDFLQKFEDYYYTKSWLISSITNAARSRLEDMAADHKLTPLEKLELQTLMTSINSEKDSLLAQAARYSVSSANYLSAYNSLTTYVGGLLANMSETTTIIRTTFNNYFATYYSRKAVLMNSIAAALKNNDDIFRSSLGDMAWEDLVGVAKLDDTVIQGGFIKTTLLDADYIRAAIINATYINSLEIEARYIRAGESGESRIEVNEKRERKNADGTGTGEWVDQNNIALFSPTGKKLIEMDDDSSQGLGVFWLEFPTSNDPGLPVTIPGVGVVSRFEEAREWNWSQFNAGSIDGRTGLQGDFSNGFPRFSQQLSYQLLSGGTRKRYYFRKATQGLNVGDPNLDTDLLANTSIGSELSNVRNLNVIGAFGTGGTKVIGSEPFDNILDSGFLNYLDHTIIFKGSTPVNFELPRFITGSDPNHLINHQALGNTQIGRELVFVNRGTANLTLVAQGTSDINLFMGTSWIDTSSIVISPGTTITVKVISKNGVPSHFGQWRWMRVN